MTADNAIQENRKCSGNWSTEAVDYSCPSCGLKDLNITNLLATWCYENEIFENKLAFFVGAIQPLLLPIIEKLQTDPFVARSMMIGYLAAAVGLIIRSDPAATYHEDKIKKLVIAVLLGTALTVAYGVSQGQSPEEIIKYTKICGIISSTQVYWVFPMKELGGKSMATGILAAIITSVFLDVIYQGIS